jgi:peptidoglycan hydrolase-like protein with peptidoglycan-binding domain
MEADKAEAEHQRLVAQQREEEAKRAQAAKADAEHKKLAALEPETPKPAPPEVDSPELVRTAQGALKRLGCYEGPQTGAHDGQTTAAIERYFQSTDKRNFGTQVTARFVDELNARDGRVCAPASCPSGQVVKGMVCVAVAPPPQKMKPKVTAHPREEEEAPRRKVIHIVHPDKAEERAKPRPPAAYPVTDVKPTAPSGGSGKTPHISGVGF